MIKWKRLTRLTSALLQAAGEIDDLGRDTGPRSPDHEKALLTAMKALEMYTGRKLTFESPSGEVAEFKPVMPLKLVRPAHKDGP